MNARMPFELSRSGGLAAALLWATACAGPGGDGAGATDTEGTSHDGHDGSTGTSTDPGGGSGSGGETPPGDDDATGDTGTGGETDDCPMPEADPELIDDPEVFCQPGFRYDRTFDLCVDDVEAVGPFSPDMVEHCEQCGGVDCDGLFWPVDQARGIRGTGECMPGTSPSDEGLCVDQDHAWGPFDPSMVMACKDAGGGEQTCEHMRWSRSFAESLVAPELGGDWGWLMPIDHGIRDDYGGGGSFYASRSGNPGGHSGIDILAPVGTPLLAPCDGELISGVAGGYGNYVQLVCRVPEFLVDGESLWASVFFAHLDTISVGSSDEVLQGDQVGTVGKTGNASGSSINAHVHFEIAVHASETDAFNETHASSNHDGNSVSGPFEDLFYENCLDPTGLSATYGPTMKGRRPDPFMLVTCLGSSNKPAIEPPPSSLQSKYMPWSDDYSADTFDVDEGIQP